MGKSVGLGVSLKRFLQLADDDPRAIPSLERRRFLAELAARVRTAPDGTPIRIQSEE